MSSVNGEASAKSDHAYDTGRYLLDRSVMRVTGDVQRPRFFRLRYWIAKAILPEAAVHEARNMLMAREHEKEKAQLAANMQIDGPCISFTLIKADNGHIIRYQARDDYNNIRKLGNGGSDKLHLVPEGGKVIEAIATIITKVNLQ